MNFEPMRKLMDRLTDWRIPGNGAVATADEANSFGFAVCDCDNCNCGCCNYSVVVTVVGAATTGTVTVNNATLIATVTEGADC